MTTSKTCNSEKSKSINRMMYGLFVALSMYFLFVKHDITSAMSNLGIALIFDPFDDKVSFTLRPLYQRIWLITHLAILFGLLGYMALRYFLKF